MIGSIAILIPNTEPYPFAAIKSGWNALGVEVTTPDNAEALCTWSPWRGSYRHAWVSKFQTTDRPIVVAEMGWLSPVHGRPYYQVALNGWNGTGSFPAGDGSRWASWGLELAPWVERPERALVVGQRGHPDDDRTSKPGWHCIVGVGDPDAIRRDRDCHRPLADDLAQVDRCHVWTSNAASHAIMAGVPVVQHGPNLMVSELASRPGEPLRRPDRVPVLEGIAWGQWDAAELAGGEPFARLLA